MVRRVDPSLTKRALAAVKRITAKAQAEDTGLTDWEDEFLTSLTTRLNTFGSAFADPDKGQLSAPLSLRQGLKLRQIGKKGDVTKPDKKPSTAGRPLGKSVGKPLARKSGLARTGFKKKGD